MGFPSRNLAMRLCFGFLFLSLSLTTQPFFAFAKQSPGDTQWSTLQEKVIGGVVRVEVESIDPDYLRTAKIFSPYFLGTEAGQSFLSPDFPGDQIPEDAVEF